MKKMISLLLAFCLAMVVEPTAAQAKDPETQRLIVDNIEINTGEKTAIPKHRQEKRV